MNAKWTIYLTEIDFILHVTHDWTEKRPDSQTRKLFTATDSKVLPGVCKIL